MDDRISETAPILMCSIWSQWEIEKWVQDVNESAPICTTFNDGRFWSEKDWFLFRELDCLHVITWSPMMIDCNCSKSDRWNISIEESAFGSITSFSKRGDWERDEPISRTGGAEAETTTSLTPLWIWFNDMCLSIRRKDGMNTPTFHTPARRISPVRDSSTATPSVSPSWKNPMRWIQLPAMSSKKDTPKPLYLLLITVPQ